MDLNIFTRASLRRAFEMMFFDKAAVTDGLVNLAYDLHLERGDGYTIRSALETVASPLERLDARLATLNVPTLVLWGEDDAITPVAMAHAFHRMIGGSQLMIVPRCGHVPPLERPGEFATAVTDFLRSRHGI